MTYLVIILFFWFNLVFLSFRKFILVHYVLRKDQNGPSVSANLTPLMKLR